MNDSRRPSDEHDLDRLLREWHADNAEAARAGRDRLLEGISDESIGIAGRIDPTTAGDARPRPGRPDPRRRQAGPGGMSLVPGTGLVAAALFVIVGILAVLVIPSPQNRAFAQTVQVPDGGRLDAFDVRGELIGPCPLQHTDVGAEISGPIVSVSIRQRYANPYDTPIEAVYTFPMSNRAAVHRMRMTVVDPDGGERVVEGEVKERDLARAIYEQARDSGFVAGLLEQERPNIFTQSVANIEPGAVVTVEIGYLEVIDARDGQYAFEFPTVVGPRYIPGSVSTPPAFGVPEGVVVRRGIVLRGPGRLVPFAEPEDWADYLQRPRQGFDGLAFDAWMTQRVDSTPQRFDSSMVEAWTSDRLFQALASAVRIDRPANIGTDDEAGDGGGKVVVTGMVDYEPAVEGGMVAGHAVPDVFTLYEGGYGVIGDRWFCWHHPGTPASGDGFAPGTDQVPDAGRITPVPVRPGTRAGHDLSISVSIDTGGVPIATLEAPLHEVVERRVGDDRVTIDLADRKTIPNRDFVLRWRLEDDAIAESVFTHVSPGVPATPDSVDEDPVPGGYLTMVLAPPARVVPEEVRPREIVFVLDTSGSMKGFPIEKSKAVVQQAIDAMRPGDTFNVITFAGRTQVLWPQPRPATPENRTAARQFIDGLAGGGGTEMMDAINQALVQVGGALPGAPELANLPADGRMVAIATPYSTISTDDGRQWLQVRDGLRLPVTLPVVLPTVKVGDPLVELNGRWITQDGERRYEVAQASFVESTVAPPMRIVMFLTDGYVGNDQTIIQAVRDNARSTRVFSLGVGNSVNRYLLDEMARHGRGAADYVLLADGADEVVDRLAKRIETPVLTDIEVAVEGVEAFEILPTNPAGLLPDLYDAGPILLHARFAVPTAGPIEGTVVITGNTGSGRYERRIPVTFSAEAPANAGIATLWGRAKVDQILDPHLAAVQAGVSRPDVEAEVVRIGEAYRLLTPFTSFVAVEKSRMVIGGKPRLVTVPIELPEGTDWTGFFGDGCPPAVRERARQLVGDDTTASSWFREGIGGQDLEMEIGLESEDDLAVIGSENLAFGSGLAAADSKIRVGSVPPPPASTSLDASRSFGRSTRGGGGAGGFGGGGGGGAGGTVAAGRTLATNPATPPASDRRSSRSRGRGAGLDAAMEALGVDSIEQLESEVREMADEADSSPTEVEDRLEGNSPERSVPEAIEAPRDLAKILRTLDRGLLMLALGGAPSEVSDLPGSGLDGRPLIDDGTVEVTMLVEGTDASACRRDLASLGVRVEGIASVGRKDTMLVVGRIAIDRLLDLGESVRVRRVVPAGDG